MAQDDDDSLEARVYEVLELIEGGLARAQRFRELSAPEKYIARDQAMARIRWRNIAHTSFAAAHVWPPELEALARSLGLASARERGSAEATLQQIVEALRDAAALRSTGLDADTDLFTTEAIDQATRLWHGVSQTQEAMLYAWPPDVADLLVEIGARPRRG